MGVRVIEVKTTYDDPEDEEQFLYYVLTGNLGREGDEGDIAWIRVLPPGWKSETADDGPRWSYPFKLDDIPGGHRKLGNGPPLDLSNDPV